MPYGMSKWVSGFIYQNSNDRNDNEYINIECIDSTNEETNLLTNNIKIIKSKDNKIHKMQFIFGILSFVLIIFIHQFCYNKYVVLCISTLTQSNIAIFVCQP